MTPSLRRAGSRHPARQARILLSRRQTEFLPERKPPPSIGRTPRVGRDSDDQVDRVRLPEGGPECPTPRTSLFSAPLPGPATIAVGCGQGRMVPRASLDLDANAPADADRPLQARLPIRAAASGMRNPPMAGRSQRRPALHRFACCVHPPSPCPVSSRLGIVRASLGPRPASTRPDAPNPTLGLTMRAADGSSGRHYVNVDERHLAGALDTAIWRKPTTRHPQYQTAGQCG
jgi:hypothetical protein